MTTLLVIADDFTGALDTAVQFSKCGISTLATTNADIALEQAPAQVLVVDTESRHLTPEHAYRIVHALARRARQAGIPHIYKKTDSALRGNIGAELAAVADVYPGETLYFLPAFPKMGRTTQNGVQYAEGTPVSQSVFGSDPFEPVRDSRVDIIIQRQSDVPVALCRTKPLPESLAHGVLVVDSGSEEDFRTVCRELKEHRKLPTLLAGCAGFAAYLPGLLGLPHGAPFAPARAERMIVLSGSVNPVSFEQQRYARQSGFALLELTPEQKLDAGYWASQIGNRFWAETGELLQHSGRLLISAASNREAVEANDRAAAQKGLEPREVRACVARNLGELGKELNEKHPGAMLFIVGGDTLYEYLVQTGATEILPQAELAPSVVQALVRSPAGSRILLTKSGGLSDPDVFAQVAQIVCPRDLEEKPQRQQEWTTSPEIGVL